MRADGPLKSVRWERHCPPFQQGQLGSCTANAITGACMTGPLFVPGRILTEEDAVKLYSVATRLDKVPGFYPPDDTGSSGLAAAKAAKQAGVISAYHHAFGLSAALHALTFGPVIGGFNWYEGFDSPIGSACELAISGAVRGGHEVCLDGIDVENGMVHITNSWGIEWGDRGRAIMSFGTLGQLLKEHGDIVVPIA